MKVLTLWFAFAVSGAATPALAAPGAGWSTEGVDAQVSGFTLVEGGVLVVVDVALHSAGGPPARGTARLWIDPGLMRVRRAQLRDATGAPVYTLLLGDFRRRGAVEVAHRVEVTDHRVARHSAFHLFVNGWSVWDRTTVEDVARPIEML